MANFAPPNPWHDSLVRSALFVAERKFTSTEPEEPGQDDELLAHRARVFVEAINRMPVEQQPANWVVADDPNAKAEWLNDKLNFMASFNRELDEENEQLRARLEGLQHSAAMTELGHYSITWDKDHVRIWCDRCPGSTIPFGTLANGGSRKPYSMTSVVCNIQEHELEHREGRV